MNKEIKKSKCCGFSISIGGKNSTKYWICNYCDKACNLLPNLPKQQEKKHIHDFKHVVENCECGARYYPEQKEKI